MIRPAVLDDLEAILALENTSFESDRLSRRNLRYMLTRGRAFTLVDEVDGRLRGYVLVLIRRGTSLARLYSIAVAPEARQHGVAAALVRAAEVEALERNCVVMRLEVRQDNDASRALFESLGYRQFGHYVSYYEDAADALRYEKYLGADRGRSLMRVPYYAQTLDFTCGPVALMMAMKALDNTLQLDRKLELRLWRESTTIFMTSGHGGCGPEGLALAAHGRGFDAAIYINQPGPLMVESVRSEEKRQVIELVHEDFMREIRDQNIPVHEGDLRVEELATAFQRGAIPIVLISLYRFHRQRTPHWVTVTGFDEHYVYVNDPWVDNESGRTATDCVNLPVPRSDFQRMARYGKAAERAVVLISRSDNQTP